MARLLQSPRFEASFGGREANAAVVLAQFGVPVALVMVLMEEIRLTIKGWESRTASVWTPYESPVKVITLSNLL